MVREWLARDDAVYLVAERAGPVLGFVNVQRAAPPKYPMFRPHEFAIIEDLVVDEQPRGEGLGTLLLQAVRAWASAHGLRQRQTSVWQVNASGIELYRAQGCRPLTLKLAMDTEAHGEAETGRNPR